MRSLAVGPSGPARTMGFGRELDDVLAVIDRVGASQGPAAVPCARARVDVTEPAGGGLGRVGGRPRAEFGGRGTVPIVPGAAVPDRPWVER